MRRGRSNNRLTASIVRAADAYLRHELFIRSVRSPPRTPARTARLLAITVYFLIDNAGVSGRDRGVAEQNARFWESRNRRNLRWDDEMSTTE